jgi:hypothetical protein
MTNQDLDTLMIELRMRPDTNSAADLNQFIKSATTDNCYTNLKFKNMTLFASTKVYNDQTFFQIPRKKMYEIHNHYDVNVQNVNLSAGGESIRYILNQHFSGHNLIKSILFYCYPSGLNTAFNYANALNYKSAIGDFNLIIKKSGKDYIRLDTNQLKMNFQNNSHKILYNRCYNLDFFNVDYHKLHCPFHFYSFVDTSNHEQDSNIVISGIKTSSEIEIMLAQLMRHVCFIVL